MEFDLKKIKELMSAMNKSGMSKLRLKVGEEEIELERKAKGGPAPVEHAPPPPVAAAPAPAAAPAAPTPDATGNFVTSPMVGSFYGSPSPESDAFVKVGDTVSEDTVVCIVEAMKVMNEVKAGAKGIIKEVLVENGHPLEFGTKMFRVG